MSEEKQILTWDEFWDGFAETNADPRKAKCSECKHRQEIPGNAHILCTALGPAGFLQVALTGFPPKVRTHIGDIPLIYAIEIGIEKGYFAWPLNFDPHWLWWCMLFESKA
jgi:hypothetical protein